MKVKLLLSSLCLAAGVGRADFALRDGDTLVFLGDSITAARGYTKIVEHYTLMRFPERRVRFFNAGQGGDTAWGCLQRLDRDVFSKGATVVAVAFGVNDIGWGMKADAEHKQRYLDGIRAIVERCQARKVRPFICSAAITAEAPDQAENGFLQKMTDEGLALARSLGAGTIDLQRGMRQVQRRIVEANTREPNEKKHTRLHADDHVHLNDLGQLAMAYAMLKGLGAPEEVSSVVLDGEKAVLLEAQGCAVSGIRKSAEGLKFTRFDRGLPLNLGILSGLNYRWVPIPEGLNRYVLAVKNLPAGEYEIRAGGRLLGKATAQSLAQGLNISSMTPDPWQPGGPWDAQSCAVKEQVDARDKLSMSSLLRERFLANGQEQTKLDRQTKTVDTGLVALQRATAKPAPYRFQIRANTATALNRAFEQLPAYDWDQSRATLQPIDEAVAASQPGSEPRQELETRLAAVLTGTASRAARDYACRQLGLIGTSKSVPALTQLLLDTDLSHLARYALERIPDAAAAAALRDAVSTARGEVQIGIISSLGAKADRDAVAVLSGLLSASDLLVVSAAVSALGKIGTVEAADALERLQAIAPSQLQQIVGNARLVAAERLARRGQRAEAAQVFRKQYRQPIAEPLRLAAFRGLVATEPKHAADLLSAALEGENAGLRKCAARMIAEQPGEHPLKPFLKALPTLPSAGQVALLDAIGARGDSSARPAVLKACESGGPAVRAAALRALGSVGRPADVLQLARIASGADVQASVAARLALANLPGREVSSAILKQVTDAQPLIRVELIRALAARFEIKAAPLMAEQLNDSSEMVRRAALESLGVLGNEQQIPPVIGFLKNTSEQAMQQLAGNSLESLVGRAASKSLPALLAGFKDAPTHSRTILLQQLGRLGGSEALAAVRTALKDTDETVRDTAFRALTAWPDAQALPDLLNFVQNEGQPARRALAFRGCVRLCREAPMSATERLAALSQPAKLAASNEEKTLIISALADVPDPGSLALLDGYLDVPGLAEAAGLAVVKLGAALQPKEKHAVVPVVQHVMKSCTNTETQARAKELLKKFGEGSQ